jgi:serine/threonine-protein kinase
MGNVYEVVHERLGRHHALKVLQSWVLENDRDSLDRFLHEAQSAARIRSSHIVEVFDFGYLDDGRPYIVMELLAGKSLCELIADGPVAPPQAVALALQLARALSAAHERDVIHADVTPANVLVTEGHVTLIDFGLAHLRQDVSGGAPADHVSGTPSYLAPERLRGLPPGDASDQYSFGVVLYELLQGCAPFTGTPQEIAVAHLYAVPAPITSVRIPIMLQAVLARCLAKEPSDRCASMDAVVAELAAIEEVMS